MMKTAIYLFLAIAMNLGMASASGFQTLTSISGETVRARLEGLEEGTVTLRLEEDFKVISSPLDVFSEQDIRKLVEDAAKMAKTVEKINDSAGCSLVSMVPFDARTAQSFAETLQLPQESQTIFGSSWRRYAKRESKSYQVFGVTPSSAALYSNQDEQAAHISLVFANKGDYKNQGKTGEDHFDNDVEITARMLSEAMSEDAEAIEKALTEALGEPTMARYGQRDTRRTVHRWDWNGYAFLLSNERLEYVSLAIMSSASADAGGKTDRLTNAEIKSRLESTIRTEENGDVWLDEIPMVNQGPKGYCAPATFERAMRKMGLDADMYLLAMLGENKIGGKGTSVGKLVGAVESIVKSKARDIDTTKVGKIKIRDVQSYIDEGVPIMWGMYSTKFYNEIARKNTKERGYTGIEPKERIKPLIEVAEDAVKDAESLKDSSHLCMIIGYNKETEELAVSDSWGPNFAIRWVPLEVANLVSQGQFTVILP